MAKLPSTPDAARLRELPPSLITLPAGTRLSRIYQRSGNYPTSWDAFRHFGSTGARFDHHEPDAQNRPGGQARGIMYLASDGLTALAEAFQEKRTVNRWSHQPWLVTAETATELSLLNLTGDFCVQAGGSMKLISGPTVYAQNWSRAFYEGYESIHGLYYPSSLTNRPVVALYERALDATSLLTAPLLHRALADALLIDPLRNACKEIGYDFV